MKIRGILWLTLAFLVTSCGSNKRVVNSTSKRSTRKVVVADHHIKTSTKLPQLEQRKTKQAKVTPRTTEGYIKKFAPIAIEEMQRYKIPASITLAQGILESGSGLSNLAIRSNNHFGIKCHKGWQGKRVSHDDDAVAECFRRYKHPKTSYEDHSKFLTSRKRYAKLFRLKITNYKAWAYGLKRAGYATDPRYPQKLIGIIRKYNLTKYDKEALLQGSINQEEITQEIPINTSGTYYKVQKGDTLYSIARRHNISIGKLKRLNNLTDNTISIGQQLQVY